MKKALTAATLVLIALSITACGRERENNGPSDYERGQQATLTNVKEALKLCHEADTAKAKLKAMPITTAEEVQARDKAYRNLRYTKDLVRKNKYTENLDACKDAREIDTDLLPQPPATTSATPPAPKTSAPMYYHNTYDSDTES